MSDLHLTMAMNHYDHVQDMATGRVKPEGIDLTVINHGPEEIFHRFLFSFEWQISEISMGMSTSRLSMDHRTIQNFRSIFPLLRKPCDSSPLHT